LVKTQRMKASGQKHSPFTSWRDGKIVKKSGQINEREDLPIKSTLGRVKGKGFQGGMEKKLEYSSRGGLGSGIGGARGESKKSRCRYSHQERGQMGPKGVRGGGGQLGSWPDANNVQRDYIKGKEYFLEH